MKYIFGPIQSRRLGSSLGIDLLPYKTCSFDCVYCECGCTTNLTNIRSEFYPTEDVINELADCLMQKPRIDYITFSGSGEPTLHTGIGRIIDYIKDNHPEYRVAVLTNGTLLGDIHVQKEISRADVVIPSIDGATSQSFEKICRPDPSVHVEQTIDGIAAFRRMYKGIMIVEIFIIPGVNDSDAEINALKSACERISPDSIQLNYLARPGCVDWIDIPSEQKLIEIKNRLSPLHVQLIERRELSGESESTMNDDPEEAVMMVVGRRSVTIEDIALTVGTDRNRAVSFVEDLIKRGLIQKTLVGGEVYYSLVKKRI